MISNEARWVIGKTDRGADKWLPLWMHLKDTAAMMAYLLDAYVPSGTRVYLAGNRTQAELRKLCIFLGAVHDIGKDTAVFQNYLMKKLSPEWQTRAIQNGFQPDIDNLGDTSQPKHYTASSVLLEHDGCPSAIVEIVGAHHGNPRAENKANKAGYQLEMLYQNYYGHGSVVGKTQKELLEFAKEETGITSYDELMVPSQGAGILLTGLLIMADWIASNTSYFPLVDVQDDPNQSCYPQRVKEGIQRLKLPDFWHPAATDSVEALCRERFLFTPNEIQVKAGEVACGMSAPGILILEAQMGKGKTEAALLAGEIMAQKSGRGGVFFGLPTQATANGLFPRIVRWAESQTTQGLMSIRLAHGTAQFNELFSSIATDVSPDDSRGLVVHEWFRGGKQALLSDYVIGTVDQVLLASLRRRHVMLRHLGLADKVIIIDECHAYDAYMNVYLMRTLSWLGLYRVPVIILSATLPCATRSRLVDAYLNRRNPPDMDAAWRTTEHYPLVTWTDGNEIRQEAIPLMEDPREVLIKQIPDDERIKILMDRLSGGGCAGVICNTVARAQAFHDTLKRFFPGETMLFHARYLSEDRAKIEKELLHFLGKPGPDTERPKRLIVVGTQVLEQSLDVDFDLLITDICPMDLLLQRIGRLHRHKGRERPESVRIPVCWICGMEEQPMQTATLIYAEYLLKRTQMLLKERICLPTDIASLVQATYRETDVPPELSEAFEKMQVKRAEAREKAACYCLPSAPSLRADARKTIRGLLDGQADGDESEAEASVRDGDGAIDVLMLVEYADGIGLVPWHEPEKRYSLTGLSEDEAKRIARERISLPHTFSGYRMTKTLAELRERGERFTEWRRSSFLSSVNFLLLNQDLEVSLSGFFLKYRQKEGLICMKEGSS